MTEPDVPTPDAASAATCQWCGTAAAADATQCGQCGASLARRESIGELMIPGLTSVDPALQDFDKRPLHLRGPSAAQGVAPALIAGAMAGGPIGLAAIGGVAAVAAVEYLGAGHGGKGGADLEAVGRPSEVVLQALDHLDEARPATGGRDIWRDLPGERPGAEEAGVEGTDGD